MVKTIIQVSDVHIQNFKRQEEYKERLTDFISECKKIAKKDGSNNVRIVICGDLVNSHNDVSNEAFVMTRWFLTELDSICKVIVFAGNHDKTSNPDRVDTLTAIFANNNLKQTTYLDSELSYKSGCVIDENVIWCLFSAFDNFRRPDIDELKKDENNKDKTFVALFHGDLVSSVTDAGHSTTVGENVSLFDGVDFGLFGHIHKRQCIDNNGAPLVFGGSLIQQNFGENISGHGYVVWDVVAKTYKTYDIPNEHSMYVVSINDIEDIDKNEEKFVNL